jgi:ubiquitin
MKNPGSNVLKYPKTPEGQAKKIQDAMAEIMRIIQAGGMEAQWLKVEERDTQQGELVEDVSMQETIEPEVECLIQWDKLLK